MIVDGGDDALTRVFTATVTKADMQGVLGRELTEEEKSTLSDFEQSWKYFAMSKQGDLPMGAQEEVFQELRNKQVEESSSASGNDTVQTELDNQIRLFQDGLAQMESEYKQKIEKEKQEFENNKRKLDAALQSIKDADKLQQETLPWAFFLSCVDAEAMKQQPDGEVFKTRAMKPSSRALYLLTQSEGTEATHDKLDALQMDHALLKAQLKILNKEIQRYEKTAVTQDLVAKFMVANNIWSIVK